MHMPVMDGIEAASAIFKLDLGIPIVAMTANIMTSDRELYRSIGIVDCVGKPFTSQALWRCLLKYLKPVDMQKEDAALTEKADAELLQQLINNFVRSNSGKFPEIADALKNNNLELAHRLAHTLKSNAAQLSKSKLRNAAEEVESSLKDGKNNVSLGQLKVLEDELNEVLAELTPLVCEPVLHENLSLPDLKKLKLLLEDYNTECLGSINNLRLVPGSEKLIQYMEMLDFESAVKELDNLM